MVRRAPRRSAGEPRAGRPGRVPVSPAGTHTQLHQPPPTGCLTLHKHKVHSGTQRRRKPEPKTELVPHCEGFKIF